MLRAVMLDPEELRPEQTPDEITEIAAARFAAIARSMRDRGYHPEAVAHHLNRVVFCLFAEDARLLPERIVTGMIESRRADPEEFTRGLSELFRLMSDRAAGRFFGNERVEWFDGGLFDGAEVIPCTRDELDAMHEAALLDWSRVEPAILGTLFERGLDPDKRGQLGAHYTDHAKIMLVVEPVVLDPLRREFAAMRERVEELAAGREPSPLTLEGRRRERLPPWERDAEAEWRAFLERLRAVRVLDPACGSGNFLYVTLRLLKDLEEQAIRWGGERLRIPGEFPRLDPHNVLGIELNPYAKELAGVSIWIGHIQWMLDHGYGFPRDPVLQPLDNIELRDAILARDAEGFPIPATWPEAEFVVGNPPFLGRSGVRLSLGDEYVDAMFEAWEGAVARESDLCLLLARDGAPTDRCGRGEARGFAGHELDPRRRNRGTLDRRQGQRRHLHGVVGRAVDRRGRRRPRLDRRAGRRLGGGAHALDGETVRAINSNLTGGVDLTGALRTYRERGRLVHGRHRRVGPFDIPGELAREMLAGKPTNINGRTNADVVVPWVNGIDVTRRPRDMFIIDFGTTMPEAEAGRPTKLPSPTSRSMSALRASRSGGRRIRERWWLHGEPRRRRCGLHLAPLSRFIATLDSGQAPPVRVAVRAPTLPDHNSSSSRGRTTTRSACCTRGRTSSGRCGWGRGSASATTRATRRRRRSRRSPSRGRSTRRTRR